MGKTTFQRLPKTESLEGSTEVARREESVGKGIKTRDTVQFPL